MQQLSKKKSILFHLYPGVLISAGFIMFTPLFMQYGFPSQFGMLMSVILVAVPTLVFHLVKAKKSENKATIAQLNGFTKRLPIGRLILYAIGLVVFAFIIWGATQPLNTIITKQLMGWLPDWYTAQDFNGYGKNKIVTTLIFNLVLNGFLAPCIEEIYFRGYLLPRMKSWGKWAFVVNAIFFSLYHFWQPYIYLTLIFSLLPMTWLVVKTKDLRLAILTHSLLNITGAILSFGLLNK
jgi:membrane protease YdiL (CAAX protease family)